MCNEIRGSNIMAVRSLPGKNKKIFVIYVMNSVQERNIRETLQFYTSSLFALHT